MDDICPPSTVFAAYNGINTDKNTIMYPYSGHSVPHAHAEPQLKHLRRYFRHSCGLLVSACTYVIGVAREQPSAHS
jgi:hypothetical protein